MSADEDTELRDLVAQTLETNGVLGKIRAQLRASVFLALEEQESVKNKTPFLNPDLKKFISTQEGRQVAGLVREFLQFFNLDYSLAVFDPESRCADNCEERDNLARDFNIIESDETSKSPLLAEVLKRGTTGRGRLSSTEAGGRGSLPEDMTMKHIQEARKKFDEYDKDTNGTIDKGELRELFVDMFPTFHRNMLDRYVNDEFRSADKDFSNAIEFDEFLDMYKRLFVLCKSSIAQDVSEITLNSPRRMQSKIPSPMKKTPPAEPLRMVQEGEGRKTPPPLSPGIDGLLSRSRLPPLGTLPPLSLVSPSSPTPGALELSDPWGFGPRGPDKDPGKPGEGLATKENSAAKEDSVAKEDSPENSFADLSASSESSERDQKSKSQAKDSMSPTARSVSQAASTKSDKSSKSRSKSSRSSRKGDATSRPREDNSEASTRVGKKSETSVRDGNNSEASVRENKRIDDGDDTDDDIQEDIEEDIPDEAESEDDSSQPKFVFNLSDIKTDTCTNSNDDPKPDTCTKSTANPNAETFTNSHDDLKPDTCTKSSGNPKADICTISTGDSKPNHKPSAESFSALCPVEGLTTRSTSKVEIVDMAPNNNTTESKNKKNSDSESRSQPLKSPVKEPKSPGFSDFDDDDSFFDDPLPVEKKSFSQGRTSPSQLTSPRGSPRSPRVSQIPRVSASAGDKKDKGGKPAGGSGMSFLAGLPSLGGNDSVPTDTKEANSEADIKQIDQNLADLGVDVPEDDYDDDDFESSKHSNSSSSISPYGQTPRSARSTHDVKSIDEDEEIEEELEVEGFKDSDGEDLLGSDISEGNDLTTDRTISPRDQSNAFDYVEDVIQH